MSRHPLGRRCGDPRVLAFVLLLMPYALTRYAIDEWRDRLLKRPLKTKPPTKPPRKPIQTKPIRLAATLSDLGNAMLPAVLFVGAITYVGWSAWWF